MYKVLYRKWRPQTFTDVCGQEHITRTLMNEVAQNRLAHAYLFTGARGTGKTSCAKILSKAINCLHPVNGNPCLECEICRGIDNGEILDIVEIDAASNRGIDDIRALREETVFSPAAAKYRVYIIDEVHMLTIEAFNALLKTLEEPPEHVKFILATTEVQKLPLTILSRCQRFDFRRIPSDDIKNRLLYIAGQEGISLTEDAAVLIARISDGGLRDALGLLDRCMSVSSEITSEIVTSSAGLMSNAYLSDMARAFSNHDASTALELVDSLHKSSCDSERLISELISYFRNILIVKTVKHAENYIICTNDAMADLKRNAALFPIDFVYYILDVLMNSSQTASRSQNKRIEAELAVMRICSPQNESDLSALTARVASLEKKLDEILTNGTAVKTSATPAGTPEAFADPAAEEIFTENDTEDFTANDELNDAPPWDEAENIFDDTPADIPEDIFDDAPADIPEDVFDDAPADIPEDIFDDDSSAPEPAPVVNKTRENVNNDAIWGKIVVQCEKNCRPLTGALLDTRATIGDNVILVYNLPSYVNSPMFLKEIEKAASTVLGREIKVKTG